MAWWRGAVLALVTTLMSSCALLGDLDEVYESSVEPVDLALPAPTFALGTPQGLVLRAGDTRRVEKRATAVEWLPGGRALVYFPGGVRTWDPTTDKLGPVVDLGGRESPLISGELKRSVTQVDVTVDSDFDRPDVTELAAYDLELNRKWEAPLPGVSDEGAQLGDEMVRSYHHGHTIDGITYLAWSEYDANGSETDPHYGLLRVGPQGKVLGDVQVNERIKSVWLAADGAALLATRRTSGHPCGGCQVELELVELEPATGAVVGGYGMPDEYDEEWDVAAVDKVGDRVAIRFVEYTEEVDGEEEVGSWLQRGTFVLDDGDWAMIEGSAEEVTWWQGPDDRIVGRPAAPAPDLGPQYDFVWLHGDEETPLAGQLETRKRGNHYEGSIPGSLLRPED